MKNSFTGTKTALAVAQYLFASLAVAATDNATLTVGKQLYPSPPFPCTTVTVGYRNGGIGSYSPVGLTGGYTVHSVYEVGCSSPSQVNLIIKGFLISPGQLWLTSITCNGITRQASAATSYSYDSATKQASWVWAGGATFGLNALPSNTNVSCAITHN